MSVSEHLRCIRAPQMSVSEHLRCPSDADGDGGDGDFPTTLPAWQVPRGYHGQGSNIPFGESLTLIYIYICIYIYI